MSCSATRAMPTGPSIQMHLLSEPDWMLLSWCPSAAVSSGNERAANLTDENARTWWRADTAVPTGNGRPLIWELCDVQAKLNFADEGIKPFGLETRSSLINMAGDRAIDLGVTRRLGCSKPRLTATMVIASMIDTTSPIRPVLLPSVPDP